MNTELHNVHYVGMNSKKTTSVRDSSQMDDGFISDSQIYESEFARPGELRPGGTGFDETEGSGKTQVFKKIVEQAAEESVEPEDALYKDKSDNVNEKLAVVGKENDEEANATA